MSNAPNAEPHQPLATHPLTTHNPSPPHRRIIPPRVRPSFKSSVGQHADSIYSSDAVPVPAVVHQLLQVLHPLAALALVQIRFGSHADDGGGAVSRPAHGWLTGACRRDDTVRKP